MSDKKTNNDKGIEITKSTHNKQAIMSDEEIEIRREGKPISFEAPETGFLYLLIDCSGSMEEGNKLAQAKRGAINFAKEAKIKGYSIGLIQFHSHATYLCEPVKEVLILDQYLKKIEIGGDTHMAEAISLAHQKLKDIKGNRVMVVVTDGMPNGPGDPEASLKAGKKAKRDGIDIITIGTDDADREFLKKIATRTDLAVMVSREKLEKGITSTAKKLPMLPGGK